MARRAALFVPLPIIRSPVVVIGDSALNAADAVVCPVPPLAIGSVPVTPVDRGSPVALVRVPLLGVPKAPPLTTKAPADPTAVPSAVNTPVPVVVVLGAAPAPPPIINALAASAVELAQVLALEKYTTPPEVPATVKAGVVVGVATVIRPPVNETDVTVPDPPPPPVALIV